MGPSLSRFKARERGKWRCGGKGPSPSRSGGLELLRELVAGGAVPGWLRGTPPQARDRVAGIGLLEQLLGLSREQLVGAGHDRVVARAFRHLGRGLRRLEIV